MTRSLPPMQSVARTRGLWLLPLLSGCLTLFDAGEIQRQYTLDPELAQPAATADNGGPVLLVSTPRPEAGYDTLRMAYMTTPHLLSYYSESQWAATPARMLAGAMAERLQATGLFAGVVLPPSPVPQDYQLEGDGLALVHEFFVRPSRVRLGVRLRLVEVRSRRILGAREIVVLESAPSEDAAGAAIAANRAATRLLDEAAVWVTATVRSAGEPPAVRARR